MEETVKNTHTFRIVVVNLCEIFTWETCKQLEIKRNTRHHLLTIEVEWIYSYTLSLTSKLVGVDGQCQAPAALPPGKRPGTVCTVGWVGSRAGLDGCGYSRPHGGFDPWTVPARSESLYWQRNPTPTRVKHGPWKWIYFWNRDYILHLSAMLPSVPNVLTRNPRALVAPRIAYVLCHSNSQGHSKVEVQSSVFYWFLRDRFKLWPLWRSGIYNEKIMAGLTLTGIVSCICGI
jgi:hypothetical protein